jgi:hypothetical protein
MLVRAPKRLLLLALPIVTLLLLGGRLFWRNPNGVQDWLQGAGTPKPRPAGALLPGAVDPAQLKALPVPETHREIKSLTTPDGKYWDVLFNTFDAKQQALNPNFLPHPALADTWITVVQERNDEAANQSFMWVSKQIVCNARFTPDHTGLACVTKPTEVPIEPTSGDLCTGERAHFNLNVGPHDARVLYGPEVPYTIFGSNGRLTTCFGIWMQDFRALHPEAREGVDRSWLSRVFGSAELPPPDAGAPFQKGTELSRPPPYGPVEKNWFLFWDFAGKEMYLHHDILPRRVFAKLHSDGTVGADMAPAAVAKGNDTMCLKAFLPEMHKDVEENIHQATNSLAVTLCKRSDPSCKASEKNTVIFTIVQHKRLTGGFMHAEYEPYVVAFEQAAPFALHGISQKPLWISGRMGYHDERKSEMMYVTSMAWKERGVKYRGYLDDVVMLGFGIEDRHPAGIDVLAEELLEGLGLCADVGGHNAIIS